jgi:HEAT repeat protein
VRRKLRADTLTAMRISYLFRNLGRALLVLTLGTVYGCGALPVSLSRYATHPQAEAAVGRLLSSDLTLVSEAKKELPILGEGTLPALRESMDSATAVGRIRIMETASVIGAPQELVGEILQKGAHDDSADVRQSAAFQAGRFPQLSERLGPVLVTLATDTSPQVRAAALSSLGTYPGTTQLEAEDLIRLTKDPNIVVAASAASLAIKRTEPRVQVAARDALPKLVGKLRDPTPANRAAILFAIGHYGSLAEPTIPPLKTVLTKDKVPEVRLQAAITLLKINTPASRKAAIPALKAFSRSSDPRLRAAAQSALALLP